MTLSFTCLILSCLFSLSQTHGDEAVLETIVVGETGSDEIHTLKFHQLNTGYFIPMIGFGTAGLKNDEQAIRWAVDAGYQLIDSASNRAPWYQNEHLIGNILQEKGNREQLFITTKLFSEDHGYHQTIKAVEDSLKLLQTDYIDLYIIHYPQCNYPCGGTWRDSWKAMEDLQMQGKIRSLGVSNFHLPTLKELFEYAAPRTLSVVQNWFDPFHQTRSVVQFCHQNGIFFQSYSTLGGQYFRHNENPVLNNIQIQEIAQRHSKSMAQVVLRWTLQHNIGILPRSKSQDKIASNLELYDFELTEQDMEIINALDGAVSVHPDK